MGTKCEFVKGFQRFYNTPQFISAGTISEDPAACVSSTSEEVIYTQAITANVLKSTAMNFRLTCSGIFSTTADSDCTFTLRWLTTDILAIASVASADEDAKMFKLEYEGRVLTTGSSGKIVACGSLVIGQTTPLYFYGATAVTGVSVDTTATGSLNVTAQMDASSADNEVNVYFGALQLFD